MPLLVASGCALGEEDGPPLEEVVGSASEAVATRGSVSNATQVAQSGLCLTADPSGLGAVTQTTCASGPRWWFKAVPITGDPGFYSIESMGNCLAVPAGATSGTNLGLAACTRLTAQRFLFHQTGPGKFRIQPKSGVNQNLCLDIEGGQPNPGAPLQLYTCKTIDVENQRFLVRPEEYKTTLACHFSQAFSFGWTLFGFRDWDTLFDGEVAFFDFHGDRFGYDCTNDSDEWIGWTQPGDFELGDWDEVFTCPAPTNTVELSRIRPPGSTDRVRVRCLR